MQVKGLVLFQALVVLLMFYGIEVGPLGLPTKRNVPISNVNTCIHLDIEQNETGLDSK